MSLRMFPYSPSMTEGASLATAGLWDGVWRLRLDLASKFLADGADPNFRDRDGRTLVSRAASGIPSFLPSSMEEAPDRDAALAAMDFLLGFCDAGIADKDGTTPLMHAAREGNFPIVERLLGRSDAKAVNKNGRTALMYAAEKGSRACVEALLPVSDTEAREMFGKSAADFGMRKDPGFWSELEAERLSAELVEASAKRVRKPSV